MIAKLAPVAIVNGPASVPPLQVAPAFIVVPPASASVPPAKLNVPSIRAAPVPLSKLVPATVREPPLATSAAPATVIAPALEMFKLSAFKKPSMVWAEVRVMIGVAAPRSMKIRCPTTGTPRLQLPAVSHAPELLLVQKLTVAAGPKNSMRLLPTCATLLVSVYVALGKLTPPGKLPVTAPVALITSNMSPLSAVNPGNSVTAIAPPSVTAPLTSIES